jgi:hypothetical protein
VKNATWTLDLNCDPRGPGFESRWVRWFLHFSCFNALLSALGRIWENFGNQSSLELYASASDVLGRSIIEICNEKLERTPDGCRSVQRKKIIILMGVLTIGWWPSVRSLLA